MSGDLKIQWFNELEIFSRVRGFFKTAIPQSVENTGLQKNDVGHLLHRPGFWHSVRIPFLISGDLRIQWFDELEIFGRFRGFFKTAKPQPVEITEVYRNDVVHSLQWKRGGKATSFSLEWDGRNWTLDVSHTIKEGSAYGCKTHPYHEQSRLAQPPRSGHAPWLRSIPFTRSIDRAPEPNPESFILLGLLEITIFELFV